MLPCFTSIQVSTRETCLPVQGAPIILSANEDPVIGEGCGSALPHDGLVLDAIKLDIGRL